MEENENKTDSEKERRIYKLERNECVRVRRGGKRHTLLLISFCTCAKKQLTFSRPCNDEGHF